MIASAYPSTATAYQKIGLCYKFLGQQKKAQEAFLRGLRIDPQDPVLAREAEEIKRSLSGGKKK
jgi:Tfp pilus assembly protein PilF